MLFARFGVRLGGRRCVFLLEQVFHQRLVGLRRAQIRLQFQCLFIGVDCRFQLTTLRQGVATIVVGAGVAAFGEALGGATVVAGLVQRHPLPLMIFEMLGGFDRALLLEQMQALLVGTQPQVFEVESVAGLRQAEQQRQAEQPAAPPGASGEQQQRQQQPVTLIGPGIEAHGLAVVAQAARTVEQAERAKIRFVEASRVVFATDAVEKRAQARTVELRHANRALLVLEETAVLLGNRRTFGGADAEHQQLCRLTVEGTPNTLAFLFVQ